LLLETVAAIIPMAALAISKAPRLYQAGAADLLAILVVLILTALPVAAIQATVAVQVDFPIVGQVAAAQADIQDVDQITANIQSVAVVAPAARTTHQLTELVPAAAWGYMVRDQAVRDSILRGVEITRQAAAATAGQVVVPAITDKIHGAAAAKVRIIFKADPMAVAVAVLGLVGQHLLAMDILAPSEFYGELL
jgi:hypothetical protein